MRYRSIWVGVLFRIGLLLGFTAVFLQIAVFLQPLLPPQFQIAPVCETITRALFQADSGKHHAHAVTQNVQSHSSHLAEQQQTTIDLSIHHSADQHPHAEHDHHDINHQCQYCTVFGHLVLPPELAVREVLDRIQVRLLAFQKIFKHVYFVLQRLFLLPQGRAPPLFA